MSKKPHLLAALVAAAVVVSTLVRPAWAGGQDRVPRFMMIYYYLGQTPVPLDWDAEGSVAMIVMPRLVTEHQLKQFAIACEDDPEGWPANSNTIYSAIVNTLNRNLQEKLGSGEVTQAEIALIADLLFDAMDGQTWYCEHEVTHVAKGGAERLTNVYFEGVPPQGAMAQGGPEGDVLVLGEFWFCELGYGGSFCYQNLAGGLVVTNNPSLISARAQFAIGWFTK